MLNILKKGAGKPHAGFKRPSIGTWLGSTTRSSLRVATLSTRCHGRKWPRVMSSITPAHGNMLSAEHERLLQDCTGQSWCRSGCRLTYTTMTHLAWWRHQTAVPNCWCLNGWWKVEIRWNRLSADRNKGTSATTAGGIYRQHLHRPTDCIACLCWQHCASQSSGLIYSFILYK